MLAPAVLVVVEYFFEPMRLSRGSLTLLWTCARLLIGDFGRRFSPAVPGATVQASTLEPWFKMPIAAAFAGVLNLIEGSHWAPLLFGLWNSLCAIG